MFVNRTGAKLLTCKAIKLDIQLNIELFSAEYEYNVLIIQVHFSKRLEHLNVII